MCGIVAVISKSKSGFAKTQQDMFYQLLYADALRGDDATGVISVFSDGDFAIAKDNEVAAGFLSEWINKKHDNMLFSRGFAAIGHNRKKTIGLNKAENAHPFVVDNSFALVHNGTLFSHDKIAKTDVDSEALAITIKTALDSEDWKASLEANLSEVNGAYACVFYDQVRHQIGFIRNKERPLAFIETENSFLIGSELPLISWIALRNGDKIKRSSDVEIGALYTIPLEGELVETKTPLSLSPSYLTQNGGNTTGTKKENQSPFQGYINKKGGNEISKSAFKRLSKRLIGKYVHLNVVDYIHANISAPDDTAVWLMCESADISANHIARVKVNLTELGLTTEDLDEKVIEGTAKVNMITVPETSHHLSVFCTDFLKAVEVNGETLH